jgi:serine/threonine-protein kinase PknK
MSSPWPLAVASSARAADNREMARQIRVVLAEDDVLLREGVASLLRNRGVEVAGQAGDPVELLELVRKESPELVITDIRMPPTHTVEGLEAARLIRQEFPHTAILVLSAHAQLEQATDLIAGGERCGYLLKDRVTDVDDFLGAIERLVDGGSVVDPMLVHELVSARRVHDPLDELSPRERDVLALMAEGRSNGAIAEKLFVSGGTIEKHVHGIFLKLDIPEAADDHRRVLAVLRYLDAR